MNVSPCCVGTDLCEIIGADIQGRVSIDAPLNRVKSMGTDLTPFLCTVLYSLAVDVLGSDAENADAGVYEAHGSTLVWG